MEENTVVSLDLSNHDYLEQLKVAIEYSKQPGKNWPLPTILVFKEQITKEVRTGAEYVIRAANKKFVIESGSVDRLKLAMLQSRWAKKTDDCRFFIIRAAETFDPAEFVNKVGPALQMLRTITPP